ncbi:alpha/beta hydrolase-fold protein [Tautonia sp. JC769]|uniref:alpha/beta hydrolase n=1 Tax=Tautonia sp. JC769 TaxID=3232135 RepID=UPI0034596838
MHIPSFCVPMAISTTLALAAAVTLARAPEPQESAGPPGPVGVPPASDADVVGPLGPPVTIPGTEQFDLRSESGLEYRIFVAGPTGEVPGPGSPVIYLTDGNGDFPVLLAAARRQSREGLGAVVVGIGYPSDDRAVQLDRRAFDLTPLASGPPPEGFPRYPSGGDDQFLEFIEGELKPVIERRYRIDRGRQALFGHSFGGLFVLHALFRKPGSFQAYIASSPSVWWDDGRILAEADAFAKEHAGERVEARLMVTVGELEQASGPGLSGEGAGTQARRRSAGTPEELAARLAAPRVEGLGVTFLEFDGETHGSVLLPAAGRAARLAIGGE